VSDENSEKEGEKGAEPSAEEAKVHAHVRENVRENVNVNVKEDVKENEDATSDSSPSGATPPTPPNLAPSASQPDARTSTSTTDEESFPTVGGLLALVDLQSRPASKAGWILRVVVTLVGAFYLYRNVNTLSGPMLSTKPPTIIPSEELPGDRFRLSEAERREIFKEFATAEIAERQRAITQNTWQGHAWSREDDRGYIERTTARASAAKHKVSLSQVYLVLDEGIREKWPGPDGKPLPGNTPAFNPRTTW
jgi:hypothetical protein